MELVRGSLPLGANERSAFSVPIQIEPLANEHLQELDQCWSTHRPAAADQVMLEFLQLTELLVEQPELGYPYRDREHIRVPGLENTPHQLIYEYLPGSDALKLVCASSQPC